MKTIYFITEGKTDRIVIQELIQRWLGDDDFLVRHVQPPTSAYVEDIETKLSEGWKGVVSWCKGERPDGAAGRNEAIRLADCLIIHTDADVAYDKDFKNPCFHPHPPQDPDRQCDWVRSELQACFDGDTLKKIIFCIPAQDLETWIISALHPELAKDNHPIDCRVEPGGLLVQKVPHKLIRRKDGKLKKITEKYMVAASKIASGWEANISSGILKCSSADGFEKEVRKMFGK